MPRPMQRINILAAGFGLLLLIQSALAGGTPVGDAFTYQGRLLIWETAEHQVIWIRRMIESQSVKDFLPKDRFIAVTVNVHWRDY